MADNEEVQTAVPLDTVAARKLIAKVKKGDADNAAEIEAVKSKGLLVVNGQLRFG